MGRRLGVLALCAACGGAPLTLDRVAARGVLGYAVVAAAGRVASVELDGDIRLVVRGGSEARVPLGPPDWDVVALAGAGDVLAAACLDGTIRLHDARTGAETARWRLDAAATSVAISSDGHFLATGSAAGVLCLRRLADAALLQCVAAHAGRVAALAFRGERLASGGWDGAALVWSVPALARLERRDGAGAVNALAFAPGGALAVARSGAPPSLPPRVEAGDVIEIWPSATRLSGHTAAPTALAWVDDRLLVSGGYDRTVRLWDVAAGVERGRLAFAGVVRALAPSPDGVWVASFAAPDDDSPSVTLVRVAP